MNNSYGTRSLMFLLGWKSRILVAGIIAYRLLTGGINTKYALYGTGGRHEILQP